MTSETNKSTIPLFDLYGEVEKNKNPGFVHIEDISTRSSEYGWKIKPHRHGRMVQILCMYSGYLSVQIDEKTFDLEDAWVITLPPGTVHGFSFNPKTEGVVITIAEPLLNAKNKQKSRQYTDDLIKSPHVIDFNDKNVLLNQIKQYAALIREELIGNALGQDVVVENLICTILLIIRRQLNNKKIELFSGRKNSKLTDFRDLLEDHYKNHWKVKDYANSLHISVSSLNRLCNTLVGISTKSMIQERLLIEAKRKLIYTRDPLDQIAYKLGYKDPAYFSRFFKKLENKSPSEYRKQENYDTHNV